MYVISEVAALQAATGATEFEHRRPFADQAAVAACVSLCQLLSQHLQRFQSGVQSTCDAAGATRMLGQPCQHCLPHGGQTTSLCSEGHGTSTTARPCGMHLQPHTLQDAIDTTGAQASVGLQLQLFVPGWTCGSALH